jgi:hypothetical protein
MRNAAFAVWVTVAAGVLLGACDSVKKSLGREKRSPDEFAVYSRAPLSLPPQYGLRPPAPGSERPQAVNPKDTAQSALLGPQPSGRGGSAPLTTAPFGSSKGLQLLLRDAGALNAEPGIRILLNREHTILAEEDKTLAEKIMFWGVPTEYGRVVDPAKEAQRIRENQALGKPITEGETPTIERKRRAILEGLF